MHIAFRTDASIQIGTGHVMRCLTLAAALRERGAACTFICRSHNGHLQELIAQQGHKVIALPVEYIDSPSSAASHANWLGADWKTDALQTQHALGTEIVDWLVVDHYALDRSWEQLLRPYCKRLMVIDDLADRPHDCDLLLDQNLGRTAEDYCSLLNPHTNMLIGTQYALLRPEFGQLRDYSLSRRAHPQLKKLLITMGGSDKDNATGKVLEALKFSDLPDDLQITVVMGSHAPWLKHVQMQANQMKRPTQVLVGVSNMAQLMADSDLAIGAAGGTGWERCSLGLPSVILVLAENQKEGAIALHKSGAAVALNSPHEIPAILRDLQSTSQINLSLLGMGRVSAELGDGRGAVRVLSHLLPYNLVARVLTRADEMLLFTWANDPLTRQNAFNSKPIPLEDHLAWLEGRLAKPEICQMFVIEQCGVPVGQVRLDLTEAGDWEIDYSVAPSYRGQGLGVRVLACGLMAFSATEGRAMLLANVKRTNIASCNVLESLGFDTQTHSGDIVAYRKLWE